MKLPNLSSMVKVGQLRYIQASFEPPELRNPDQLVHKILPLRERVLAFGQGATRLNKLRMQPFYYYLLARTKYYDNLFVSSLEQGTACIINIGCGSDTRVHRFRETLAARGATALEMDQAAAISVKQTIASRHWPESLVEYAPIDLNDTRWPALQAYLAEHRGTRVQVIMEGVSPYVDADSFGGFLAFLARTLAPGSRIAYDFKVQGVDDTFGASSRTIRPFRLIAERAEVDRYHDALGLRLSAYETSSALAGRVVPELDRLGVKPFVNDALVQLEVPGLFQGELQ